MLDLLHPKLKAFAATRGIELVDYDSVALLIDYPQIQGRLRRSMRMDNDPRSPRAQERLRRLVRVLHRHEVDLDDLVVVTDAGIVVAIEARAYRDPLVVHEVVGGGPDAMWPFTWIEGFLVLGLLLPPSAPRLGESVDDAPGAVPVLVIRGDNVEVTFIAHENLQRQVPS